MNRNHSVNPIWMILVTLAMIILIVTGVLVFLPFTSGSGKNAGIVEQGISYLKSQEAKDISALDVQVKEKRDPAETEGMTSWEIMDYYDTYIIGDSRVEVLYWAGIQMEHVFVEKNSTIRYLDERMEDIAAAHPANLVMSFGINDLGMYTYDPDNYWETADDYIAELDTYIRTIRERSPGTNIYINSIIPVQDYILEVQPRWALIDEWNAALQQYCSENDLVYIDANYIADEFGEFFDDDGVHFYEQAAIDAWGETIADAIVKRMTG